MCEIRATPELFDCGFDDLGNNWAEVRPFVGSSILEPAFDQIEQVVVAYPSGFCAEEFSYRRVLPGGCCFGGTTGASAASSPIRST